MSTVHSQRVHGAADYEELQKLVERGSIGSLLSTILLAYVRGTLGQKLTNCFVLGSAGQTTTPN